MSRRERPWSGPARPTCPKCGRPAYPVPSGGTVHWVTLSADASGWTYGPHVCLPAGARYGAPAVREGPPLAAERAEFFGAE